MSIPKSTNKRSRRVSDAFNQNAMTKGMKIAAGLYRGTVVENGDPNQMGRVKVQIFGLNAAYDSSIDPGNPDAYLGAIWCRQLSPFGGTTSGSDGTVSHGLTGGGIPVGTEVLVSFGADSDKGVILGVLPDEKKNSTMAGPVGGISSDGEFTQVTSTSRDSRSSDNPPSHPQAEALRSQGLNTDRLRGPSFSNPRRETPSRVIGMSSADGHSIVMDDGSAEDNTSNIMRFRTAGGAQILMDDTNGFTYIINRDGTTWIEMNRNGDLDVYAASSINMHTLGNFNVHAKGAINMQADLDVNIQANGARGMKLTALNGSMDIFCHTNLQIQAEANGNLRCGGNYRETAARIDMNGPTAVAATKPTMTQLTGNKTVTESVATRVPEAEPWNGHLDVSVVDTTSASGAENTAASDNFYYNAPANPNADAGGSTNTAPPGGFPDAEDDPSGLFAWDAGVDRRVDPDLLELVREVARRFGRKLVLKSGYRDPGRNARAGGAKLSQHMQGKAVDVASAGFGRQEVLRLCQIASEVGVIGLGIYSSGNTHFDNRSGARASWGDDFTRRSTPSWAREVAANHRAGRYS